MKFKVKLVKNDQPEKDLLLINDEDLLNIEFKQSLINNLSNIAMFSYNNILNYNSRNPEAQIDENQFLKYTGDKNLVRVLPVLTSALMHNAKHPDQQIDITKIMSPNYSEVQANEIKQGLIFNAKNPQTPINIDKISTPIYDAFQMEELRIAMEYNAKSLNKIDENILFDHNKSHMQMRVLRSAMIYNTTHKDKINLKLFNDMPKDMSYVDKILYAIDFNQKYDSVDIDINYLLKFKDVNQITNIIDASLYKLDIKKYITPETDPEKIKFTYKILHHNKSNRLQLIDVDKNLKLAREGSVNAYYNDVLFNALKVNTYVNDNFKIDVNTDFQELNNFQLLEVNKGLKYNMQHLDNPIDVSVYTKKEYGQLHMEQIRLALKHNVLNPYDQIDLSYILSPYANLQTVKNLIENRIDKTLIYEDKEFDKDQLEQIKLGINDGLDVDIYADYDFTAEQMYALRIILLQIETDDLCSDIDISIIANSEYSPSEMIALFNHQLLDKMPIENKINYYQNTNGENYDTKTTDDYCI